MTFTADAAGRLDVLVAARVPALSRAQVKRLVEEGDVTVNGAPAAKAGQALRVGDRIEVRLRAPEPVSHAPEDIPLVVLYEDSDLIVLDKPAGMVVHPAPGHSAGTLVNALLAHCTDLSGIGGELRPGIVHRLDKDTTGVLVVTKNDAAHQVLSAAFKSKTLLREYVAVVSAAPREARGTIRTLYGRSPHDRKKFSSKVERGKTAVTHWQVRERFAGGPALVVLRLETGRTHQIRVHMADHGWPLVGDRTYGRPSPLIGRQALHAARLEFAHPITGEMLRFETEPPEDFQRLLERLRE